MNDPKIRFEVDEAVLEELRQLRQALQELLLEIREGLDRHFRRGDWH